MPDQIQSSHPAAQPASWRGILLVFLIALAVRAAACANLACISRDAAHFVAFAKAIERDPIAALRAESKQPGFPLLLLAAHKALSPRLTWPAPIIWERLGQSIAALGAAAACALIYCIAARLFNKPTASLAAFFACLWPQNIALSADVLSDAPHLALYLASLLLAYRAVAGASLTAITLAGIVAGLAYWLRQEAIGLAILAPCFFLSPMNLTRKRRFIGAALFLLAMTALAAPYSLAVGKFIPNKSPWDDRPREEASAIHSPSSPSRSGLHPGFRGADFQPLICGAGSSPVTNSPAHFIPWTTAPLRMLELWSKSGRYVFSTLAILGAILPFVPRGHRHGRNLIFALVLIHLILVEARVAKYGEISSRYLFIPAALTIPWAANALLSIIRRITKTRAITQPTIPVHPAHTTSGSYFAWSLALLIAAAPLIYYAARPVGQNDAPLRTGGLWLLENSTKKRPVIGHENLDQFMFYADRSKPDGTWIALPESDRLAHALAASRGSGARWLVVDEIARKSRAKVDVADYRRGSYYFLRLQWTGRNKTGSILIYLIEEN